MGGLDVHLIFHPIGRTKAILVVALAVALPLAAVLLGIFLGEVTDKDEEANYDQDICRTEEQR